MNRKNVFLLVLILLSVLVAFGQYEVDQGIDRSAVYKANNGSDFTNPQAVPANIGAVSSSGANIDTAASATFRTAFNVPSVLDMIASLDLKLSSSTVDITNGGTGQIASSAALTALGGAASVQPIWIDVTYQNSWETYGEGNPIFATASYMMDTLGFVHLRGQACNGLLGQTMFTLPVGYRPLVQTSYAVMSNVILGRFGIDPNGAGNCDVGTSTMVSLDGIIFPTH